MLIILLELVKETEKEEKYSKRNENTRRMEKMRRRKRGQGVAWVLFGRRVCLFVFIFSVVYLVLV